MEWVTEKCEGKRGSGLSVIHALLIADIRFRCDDLLSNRKVKDTYTTNTTVLLSYNAQSSMYFIDANDVMCRSHCQLFKLFQWFSPLSQYPPPALRVSQVFSAYRSEKHISQTWGLYDVPLEQQWRSPVFDAKNRDLSNKRIDKKQMGRTRAERERPDSRPSNKAQAFYMNCEL